MTVAATTGTLALVSANKDAWSDSEVSDEWMLHDKCVTIIYTITSVSLLVEIMIQMHSWAWLCWETIAYNYIKLNKLILPWFCIGLMTKVSRVKQHPHLGRHTRKGKMVHMKGDSSEHGMPQRLSKHHNWAILLTLYCIIHTVSYQFIIAMWFVHYVVIHQYHHHQYHHQYLSLTK